MHGETVKFTSIFKFVLKRNTNCTRRKKKMTVQSRQENQNSYIYSVWMLIQSNLWVKRETFVSIITGCIGRISISFANTICWEREGLFFVHLHQEASKNAFHRTYHDSLLFWERTLNCMARQQFRKIFKEYLHCVTSFCCKKQLHSRSIRYGHIFLPITSSTSWSSDTLRQTILMHLSKMRQLKVENSSPPTHSWRNSP